MVKTKLTPGGILVTQSGAAGIKQHKAVWAPIHSTLKAVFPKVNAYKQAVYSFIDEWGWNIAFTDGARNVAMKPEDVDRLISERLGSNAATLKFLDGISWQGIWATSKTHRQTLAQETTVMSTSGTHKFMHNPGVATVGERSKL